MEVQQKLLQISSAKLSKFQEFRAKGEFHAAELFKVIQSRSVFGISRFKIVANKGFRSSTKKCDPNHPDFDLVVFVNHQTYPPFIAVLNDIEKVLKKHKCKDHHFIFEQRTPLSVQFLMREISPPPEKGENSNEITTMNSSIELEIEQKLQDNQKICPTFFSFDIFPAMNFISKEEEVFSPSAVEKIQTDRSLFFLAELANPRKDTIFYNSNLAEAYATFVDKQISFAHRVICLAKLWNRKVPWGTSGKLYGRSMIIELVAISAASAEIVRAKKNKRRVDILQAFVHFLTMFLDFDKYMLELFTFPETIILRHPYKKYVEETCFLGGPVILDPVNPFNNLALNVTCKMKGAFKFHAEFTIAAIQKPDLWKTGN